MSNTNSINPLDISLGHKHLIVQRRYEAVGALNDLLIGIWFLIGSFFFLSDALVEDGTWLFILGSAQLLIKPAIKLTSLLHLGRIHPQLHSTSPFKK
ncbi:YrhK family protein [Marinomonas posidonica]|uniref:YrhK family protein n=1 Tax=Marinomonas posidonica TaxID=936476 RepID=UPI0037361B8B